MAGAGEKYNLLTYVWSEVFDLHLEFGGDEAEYESLLVRGRMEEKSFAVLYLKGGRLTAYFAVNTPRKQYRLLGKLIELKKDLAGREAELQDPASDLQKLL
jgi:3-phenylpropionate/trans-cinnamate dioxygenase ferredoxin reductase subunit